MKAEHRKELETNLLADRMGTLIKKMKGGSQRQVIVNTFLILLACFVAFIVYRFWQGDPAEAAKRWIDLDKGELNLLAGDAENNNTSKAARFEIAQFELWWGVRFLASQPVNALKKIGSAQRTYEELATDCANDKEWLAEALYGQAVAEETLAVVDYKKLASAIKKYEELDDKKLGGTARGALAKVRAKDLTDNTAKFTEFYKEMNREFNLVPQDMPRVRDFLDPKAKAKPAQAPK